MPQDKIYANGLLIKSRKVTFDGNETEILTVSINVEDFKTFLDENKNAGGWVKLDIKERKVPSDKGHTHYAVLDTWEPNKGTDTPVKTPSKTPVKKSKAPVASSPDDDDIPF